MPQAINIDGGGTQKPGVINVSIQEGPNADAWRAGYNQALAGLNSGHTFTDAEILLMPLDKLFALYYGLGKWTSCYEYTPNPQVSGTAPGFYGGFPVGYEHERSLQRRIRTLRPDARHLRDPATGELVDGLIDFDSLPQTVTMPPCETSLWEDIGSGIIQYASILSPGGWYKLVLLAVSLSKTIAALREAAARQNQIRALQAQVTGGFGGAVVDSQIDLLANWGIDYPTRTESEAAPWPTTAETERYAAILGLPHPAMIVPAFLAAYPMEQKHWFLIFFQDRARKRRLVELMNWENAIRAAQWQWKWITDPVSGAQTFFPASDANNMTLPLPGTSGKRVPLSQALASMPAGLDKGWSVKLTFKTSELGELSRMTYPRPVCHYAQPAPAPPICDPLTTVPYPGAAKAGEIEAYRARTQAQMCKLGQVGVPGKDRPFNELEILARFGSESDLFYCVSPDPINVMLSDAQKRELPEFFHNGTASPARENAGVAVAPAQVSPSFSVQAGTMPAAANPALAPAKKLNGIELAVIVLVGLISLKP